MFFIREYGQNGKKNKITIYNKKNITVDIDQDPINQFVFDTSNQLQSSSPMVLYNFKLLISTYVSSITNRAYNNFNKLFTCNRYAVTNPLQCALQEDFIGKWGGGWEKISIGSFNAV